MNSGYTRAEFLTALQRRGYQRTVRWHEEWVTRGLLDRGRRGRRGVKARWQHEQLELAASLLNHSEKGAHLGSLANVVVLVWLWWGNKFVPLRQVPRALLTWVDAEREPAEKHVRSSAHELINKIAHPSGSGRRRLTEALVDLTYHPQPDLERLRDLFDDVFDPDRTGRSPGPLGARLSTNVYLSLIATRLKARTELGSFRAAEYEAARQLYLWSRIEYARLQPDYARDPDLGHFYEAPDLNDLANSACADLLLCLAAIRRLGVCS